MNRDHLPGDLRRDVHNMGIDKSVVRIFILARIKPIDEPSDQQHDHEDRTAYLYPGILQKPRLFVLFVTIATLPALIIGWLIAAAAVIGLFAVPLARAAVSVAVLPIVRRHRCTLREVLRLERHRGGKVPVGNPVNRAA